MEWSVLFVAYRIRLRFSKKDAVEGVFFYFGDVRKPVPGRGRDGPGTGLGPSPNIFKGGEGR